MKISKILKLPILVARDILKTIITYIPGGTGNRLRYLYYKTVFKNCGNNVIIDVGVIIEGAEYIRVGNNVKIDKYCIISTGRNLSGNITRRKNKHYKHEEGELIIGDNVHITQFCIIMAYGGISIGNNCGLSASTKVYSLTNTPTDPAHPNTIISIMPLGSPVSPYRLAPVVIEENTWIALQCIIMPGTFIGKNSFVESNSLVVGSFIENSYLGGQPAKRIRERFPESKTVTDK